MTALASTDVTITPSAASRRVISSRIKECEVTIAFGNGALTYPAAGVPLPTTLGAFGFPLPLRSLEIIGNRNTTSGTHYYADVSTPASPVLHGWHHGYTPQVAVSEVVTLTSNAGTLKYKPAYIICAVGTISATVQPLRPCPTGVTLATKEFTIDFTTGGVTTKSSDSVTAMAVTYIPQQPSGPFSASNMAIDEVIVLATATVNTAARAAAVQYAYQTTATAVRLSFGQAIASNVLLLDINNSAATTIDCHADNDTKSAKITYLKYAGFQQPGTEWIDQATLTLTSEAVEFGKTAGDRVGGIIIPGLGGQTVFLADAAYAATYIGDSTATAASGIVKFDIVKQTILTAETGDAESLHETPLLFLSPFYTSHHGLAELTVNHAPIATSLRAIARF